MAYNVTATDVVDRWRPLSSAEEDLATVLLEDATMLIDVHRRAVAAAVAAGLIPERLVVMTATEAVIRVLTNPDRLANQSITADGGISVGWQFEREKPAPRLRLTDLDFSTLDAALVAAGLSTGRTGVLKTVSSTRYMDLVAGDDDDSDPVLPFPYTKLDSVGMTDNYIIVCQ